VSNERSKDWSRRAFVRGLSLGGTVAFLGLPDRGSPLDLPGSDGTAEKSVIRSAAAESSLETTTIRLIRAWDPSTPKIPVLCMAPQLLAEELLRAEGFTDIRYVERVAGLPSFRALAAGEGDLSTGTTLTFITQLDVGAPVVLLTGLHVGCYELFGTSAVRSVRDLKGKTVSIASLGAGPHLLLAAMAAYVGLDPNRDIHWVALPFAESMRLLAERKIDGFMGFAPEPQELRAKKIGHVIVNTSTDRPWSRYFCCSVAGNRAFVRNHPVAAKRAVRAILKTADLCSREPERAARLLMQKGYAAPLDYALEAVMQIPYGMWRHYDPEDSVRFYSLRLHEVGLIKSTPQKILSQGTDWRILKELKKELKA
jgi:NitT/TauT family transport system substrate-binding protein